MTDSYAGRLLLNSSCVQVLQIDEPLGCGQWRLDRCALAHQSDNLFHPSKIDLARFRQDAAVGFEIERKGQLRVRPGKSSGFHNRGDDLVALRRIPDEVKG